MVGVEGWWGLEGGWLRSDWSIELESRVVGVVGSRCGRGLGVVGSRGGGS